LTLHEGSTVAAPAAAEELVRRQTARTGDKSFDTAAARGILAIGYARAARDADAVREFKTSIPIMLAAARENADDDDATVVAARSARLQRIVEAYISVLLRTPNMSDDVAMETFALADAVRGHAVQKALADSSARAVAKNPGLAQLVRERLVNELELIDRPHQPAFRESWTLLSKGYCWRNRGLASISAAMAGRKPRGGAAHTRERASG
jgi:hypothetical protein